MKERVDGLDEVDEVDKMDELDREDRGGSIEDTGGRGGFDMGPPAQKQG
jgi:hypothetical protein